MREITTVVALLAAGSVASAEFASLDTQDRNVFVSTTADDGDGPMMADLDDAAPDFGPFNVFIQASTPLPGAAAFGTADQSSTLTTDDESLVIDASGFGFSSVAVNFPSDIDDTNTADASAGSNLDVGFELFSDSIISIDGVLSVDLSGIGDTAFAEFAFVNADTDEVIYSQMIDFDDNPGGSTDLPLDVEGLKVSAGNYQVIATAHSEAAASISGDDDVLSAIGSSEAAFDVTFTAVIPTPGSIVLVGLGGLAMAARRRRD